jgi:hypothetical protein
MTLRPTAQLESIPTNVFYLITSVCGGASLLVANGVRGALFKSDTRKLKTFKSEKAATTFLEARRLIPF